MPDDVDEHVPRFAIGVGRALRPAESLAMAVLADAVRTLQRYARVDDRAACMRVAEVEAWFACDDRDHPFAFASICDMLALDVDYVRSGLLQWRESQQVAIPTEPRALRLPTQGRPGGRVVRLPLRANPGRLSPAGRSSR